MGTKVWIQKINAIIQEQKLRGHVDTNTNILDINTKTCKLDMSE